MSTVGAPLVSIVMPVHNAGRWLRASLDSVFAQTHRPLEILAVDDGSTDDTSGILAEYATRHADVMRVVSLPTPTGASAARNRGLLEVTGAYVKFLDADDLLSPDHVALQVAALAAHPGRIAHSEWSRFYSDPTEARFTPRPGWHDSGRPVDWICETWADAEPMYQCGMFLIPRELLARAGGWNEELSLIDDFEFFTRLILASEGIAHTPGAHLHYRSGLPGSLSSRKSRRAWESAHRSVRLACEHLLAREDSPRTRRAAADACQNLVHSLYPDHPDLVADLLAEVRRLGGSRLRPDGGRVFKILTRMLGWRAALRIRRRRESSRAAA
jgi:Glycosyltransferases involved in cell wall biogenesis